MPTINDSTVVASAYTTSASARPQRLSNGWIVSAMYSATNVYFYVSKDNGLTDTLLVQSAMATASLSLASKGTMIYFIYNTNSTYQSAGYFDATTVVSLSASMVDIGQTLVGAGCSLAINDLGTELHATWSSKNATYPNSFNIRYAKGTIAVDGSVTWGTVMQVSTDGSGTNSITPSIIVNKNNYPCILFNFNATSVSNIYSYNYNGSTWVVSPIIYAGGTYAQSAPSAIFVPTSINGLANGRIECYWKGFDSASPSGNRIRFSYSDDLGVTWSAMVIISPTTGFDRFDPTATVNKSNEAFILFALNEGSAKNIYQVKRATNGTWGAETKITANASGNCMYPSSIYDPTFNFTSPLYIYQNSLSAKVGFYGTWTVTTISVTQGLITGSGIINTNFVGKVSGSVVANPNIVKASNIKTTLDNPSTYSETSDYTGLLSLDGSNKQVVSSTQGVIPQIMFSFDVIKNYEKKFGVIPSITQSLADKIVWLKANVPSFTINWTGYGSCPSGNKAYLAMFRVLSNAWSNAPKTNITSIPSLISTQGQWFDTIANSIDANGFVHFLAYTDMASTTSPTLLVLTAHGLIPGDIIENVTRTSGLFYLQSAGVPTVNTLNIGIAGQAIGDVINKYKRQSPAKVLEVGTTTTNVKITAHGQITGNVVFNLSRNTMSKITVVDANNFTVNTTIPLQTNGDSMFFHTLTTQNAESTVIPSTIYTDYVSLDITLNGMVGSSDRNNLLTYAITTDGTMSTISEKVNGVEVGSKSLTSGASSIVGLSQVQWDLIKYGKYKDATSGLNTLTVAMGTDTFTYTFSKTLAASDDITSSMKAVADANSTFLPSVKAKLGSAIRAKGGSVNDTDSFDAMVSAVSGITLGKKYASGTVVISSVSPYNCIVRGLSFQPSIILVEDRTPSFSQSIVYHNLPNIDKLRHWNNPSNSAGTDINAVWIIYSDGFQVNCNGPQTVTWTAIE